MSLSERQEHFRYGDIASEWRYLESPSLDSAITEAMRREGLDEKYRVIWGGVAIVRANPAAVSGEIKGDARATEVNPHSRRLQPAYLYGRARQPVSDLWCYEDELGQTIRTGNKDLIPPGYVVWQEKEYAYVEFGILRWHVEAFCAGGWHWIQTVETEDGLYLDADPSLVPMLRRREWENRNADLKEVVRRDREHRAEIRRKREALEDRKKRQMAAAMTADFFRQIQKQDRTSPSVTLN